MALVETVRDSQKSKETMKDMQQTYGNDRYDDGQPATTEDSERHVETPWEWRGSERELVAIGDSETQAATLFY